MNKNIFISLAFSHRCTFESNNPYFRSRQIIIKQSVCFTKHDLIKIFFFSFLLMFQVFWQHRSRVNDFFSLCHRTKTIREIFRKNKLILMILSAFVFQPLRAVSNKRRCQERNVGDKSERRRERLNTTEIK